MGKMVTSVDLFETKTAKGRIAYRLYAVSVFVGICFIGFYRVIHLPPAKTAGRRWAWIGVFTAEIWFTFYWSLTQFVRWNPIYRSTFKHRLSQRFEKDLPMVDIFVCTADPTKEPPLMVVNSVLSYMAYDYPREKLSVYLSDDAGSELTFYALFEASRFAKHWVPFCEKFKVEPRSPAAYFSSVHHYDQPSSDDNDLHHLASVKKLYEEMRDRIEIAVRLRRTPADIRKEHKGFREWDSVSTRLDHPAVVQILIDGRDMDIQQDYQLPTLVYLSREKRLHYLYHNFKAGAMNALIRVSSRISNGSIILNVDCDVYANDSGSVRDALCFFMDDKNNGHEIAYVQYPQSYSNLPRNDLYGISFRVPNEVELAAMDANGGPCYIGSGCFHRRESLCGMEYSKGWRKEMDKNEKQAANELEDVCKVLATCTYEHNTQWGKKMGVTYGFPAEDIITGLLIQCSGWKSIYFNPERKAFRGVAPTTLLEALIQQKRWSEGTFQIFLSKYCPLIYVVRKIPFQLRMSYTLYLLWAPNCLPTLYYVTVPSLFLLRGISLFPQITSSWILPFTYVILAEHGYTLAEFLACGGTLQGWWNEQRMWLFRRTSSFTFAFLETISRQLGFSEFEFVITAKVADDNDQVYQRYSQETMEFGSPSLMFIVLSTIAMVNLLSFAWGLKRMIMMRNGKIEFLERLGMQIVVCGVIGLINLPVYKGLFFRSDKGKLPPSVMYKSVMLALLVSSIALSCY